ncbi:hypothetical protein [Streptomyces sp. CoT10]|uniref:hypothetical protein n=1 Tax=Streptomyces sp. CoT10 TaxID=2875762 RepID=UPI001CD3EC9C|nr:hypothetical protein [Streptomyces sp. CoT10]
MTVDKPVSGAEGAEAPPIPWFGPTLHELVPGTAPGTRPPILRKRVGQALAAARQDPDRRERIRRADHASRGAVDSLVAEMLTPPLPRHDTEELP